jgi:hypothetical protein
VHSELSGDIVVEDVERSADDGSGGTQVPVHVKAVARLLVALIAVRTCGSSYLQRNP